MTPSIIELASTPEDHHLAKMAAVAIALSVVENAIPSPIPGIKPGLANIVVLIVFMRYGFTSALWVALLRVIAGSMMMGTFLSPTFVLSFSGACASLFVLGLIRLPPSSFGPVSLSILSSFSHITAQLAVVYFWLIPHAALLHLAPLFALAALVFGTANGLIVGRYCMNKHCPEGAPIIKNAYL